MFNKIKNKIKEKLISFLDIDMLIDLLLETQQVNNERLLPLETKSKLHGQVLKKHDEKIHALHDTLSSVVSIGSDIAYHSSGSSWAVVCIEGKHNVVKFINLNSRDARDILHFLKHFEAGRHVHDTPSMLRNEAKKLFVDWNKKREE